MRNAIAAMLILSLAPIEARAQASADPVLADAGIDVPLLADPCADGGLAKLDTSDLPDGGPALPQAICAGQPAPAPGVYETVARAAQQAAERDADKYTIQHQAAALDQPQQPLFSTSATIVGAVALGIGVVGGILIGVFFRPVQK